MESHSNNPISVQESYYSLPYHWFPEFRLKQYERFVKQQIILGLIGQYSEAQIDNYLDVGCGDGRWTTDIFNNLNNKKTNALGFDISERAIGFAKLISPFITFKSYSGDTFPAPDNNFDLVSCIEVIEHIPDASEKKFVQELFRVTKPGGMLLLTTPSVNEKISPHHFRHYAIKDLLQLLSDVGYTDFVVKGQSIRLHPKLKWLRGWFNHLPFIWMLWKFSYNEKDPTRAINLFVTARKRKK